MQHFGYLLDFIALVILSIGFKFLMSYIYPITIECSLLLWFILHTMWARDKLYVAIAELIHPRPTLWEIVNSRINNIDE